MTVDPAGPNNDRPGVGFACSQFTLKLGESVNTLRIRRVTLRVKPFEFAVENIIGRNGNKYGIVISARISEIFDAVRVSSKGRVSRRLCAVYICVGGTIDDHIRLYVSCGLLDGFPFVDVKFLSGKRKYLIAHAAAMLRGRLGDHSICACD